MQAEREGGYARKGKINSSIGDFCLFMASLFPVWREVEVLFCTTE